MNNNELKHHGVKGMRWGVRRDVSKSIYETSKNVSKTIDDTGIGRKPSKKQKQEMSQMSDAELRARINRMDMERRYSELNPSKTARGAQTAKSILAVVGGVSAVAGSVASVMIAYHTIKGYKKN